MNYRFISAALAAFPVPCDSMVCTTRIPALWCLMACVDWSRLFDNNCKLGKELNLYLKKNHFLLKYKCIWLFLKACCKFNGDYYLVVQAIVPVDRSEYSILFDVYPDFVLTRPGGRLAHCWYRKTANRCVGSKKHPWKAVGPLMILHAFLFAKSGLPATHQRFTRYTLAVICYSPAVHPLHNQHFIRYTSAGHPLRNLWYTASGLPAIHQQVFLQFDFLACSLRLRSGNLPARFQRPWT